MTTTPKIQYRVSVLGGGTRHFRKLTAATKFARKQSAMSWAQEPWVIWDRFANRAALIVTFDGIAYDPFARSVTI